MNRSRHTPWLLLIIGASFLTLTGWSIYRASQGTSAVTDRDYYSHGLRYNESLLEEKAAEALGWQTRINLQKRTVVILLSDGSQQPVSRAIGSLTLLNSAAHQPHPLPLQEGIPGRYHVQLPNNLHGEYSVDLNFERDGARLTRRILLALD